MAEKKLAKKILSRKEFEAASDAAKNKTVVPGTGSRNVIKDEVLEKTKIKDFERKQKDLKGLRNIKDAAKELKKAGQDKEADNLLRKALNSKAAQRIKKGLKSKIFSSIPAIGTAAAALASDDASAALPVLGSATRLGPEKGTMADKLESGKKLTKEEKEKFKKMQNKALSRFKTK